MIMGRRFSQVLIMTLSLLIGGAAFVWNVALRFQERSEAVADIAREICPNKIENYRNSVNWYRGPNRITVSAKTACGSKYGDEYELSDVTVEIRSGHHVITQAHASNGAFWPGRRTMLIGKSDAAADAVKNKSCVSSFNLMQIDLKNGEMKTPGMRAVLNSKDEVRCSFRGIHHG
jgi:hypothetical protein